MSPEDEIKYLEEKLKSKNVSLQKVMDIKDRILQLKRDMGYDIGDNNDDIECIGCGS